MDKEKSIHFIPSKIEGLPKVTEIIVYPNRLEFLSAGKLMAFYLSDMTNSYLPNWLNYLFYFCACRLWRPIGERDWFHTPSERFIRFYTNPKITVYMPIEESEDYLESHFFRIQQVMLLGRFDTFDLG